MPKFLVVCVTCLLSACASQAIQPDPIYRETQVRQSRPKLDAEVFDSQESDPRLNASFAAADRLAERRVGNVPRDERFVLVFWRTKKEILERRYGIDWQSPAELNPRIQYEDYGQPAITTLEEESIRKLLAPLLSKNQVIHGIWRDFDGEVGVSTTDSVRGPGCPDSCQTYHLQGHDRTWKVTDAFGPIVP